MSRITTDVDKLESLFAGTIIHIIKDILTFIVGVSAMFYLHWKLALVSIMILPFFAVTSIYFSKKIRNISKIFFEDSANTSKLLEETLSMVELVKMFSRENFNILRFLKTSRILFYSHLKYIKLHYINNGSLRVIGGIAPVIITGYGTYEIIQGKMSLGTMVAFNSFIAYLFGPVSRLININIEIQKALVAFDRVKEIFNLPEQKRDEFYKLEKINSIEFKKITFGYDKNMPILVDISLEIEQGQKIGIVGGSGSGKTTLLKILAGMYEINKGSISVNENILTNEQIITLRKYIGIVEQEPFLFNDTIYNNIKFGSVASKEKEILKVAKLAHVDEFVSKMKKGYKAEVGNMGSNLSVGQKQRIAIARALLKNPKILILDEATSNIDTISEKYISKTISELSKDIIVIIVAHRLSTIRNCDKIFVLDRGGIMESGTHEELLKNEKYYYKLHN